MLMYGNSMNIQDTGKIYNLTSLREGFPTLNLLIPPNVMGLLTGKDFDIAYANYILGNNPVFMQFFTIIMDLYNGIDIYIIISDDEWSENLAESLFKLIQQRYGFNSIKINSFEDFVYAQNFQENDLTNYLPFFMENLDQDKERYSYLSAMNAIRGGKTEEWMNS